LYGAPAGVHAMTMPTNATGTLGCRCFELFQYGAVVRGLNSLGRALQAHCSIFAAVYTLAAGRLYMVLSKDGAWLVFCVLFGKSCAVSDEIDQIQNA